MRDSRSLVMICEKDASPCINSASPGARGSIDVPEIGAEAARSTTTTRASRAISRASVSVANVMASVDAVPSTVTLRAPSSAPRHASASRSISSNSVAISGASPATGSLSLDTIAGDAWIEADGDINAAAARGAVRRKSSPVRIAPPESSNVASVAISTIGSFFG